MNCQEAVSYTLTHKNLETINKIPVFVKFSMSDNTMNRERHELSI